MRLFASLAVGMLAALIFLACNSTDKTTSNSPAVVANPNRPAPAQVKPPNDGVRRITTVELKDLLAKGQAVVVDVRNEAAYNIAHIKGAKLIPTNEFLGRLGELPRDKIVVTYCS
jgi:rhodanese-like protein